MNQLIPISSPALPVAAAAGARASMRFLEFFAANIRNGRIPGLVRERRRAVDRRPVLHRRKRWRWGLAWRSPLRTAMIARIRDAAIPPTPRENRGGQSRISNFMADQPKPQPVAVATRKKSADRPTVH